MKIWVFTNEFEGNFIGGLGVAATHISRELNEFENDVTVICNHDKAKVLVEHSEGIRIIRFPKRSKYFTKSGKSYRPSTISQYLRKKNLGLPNLIHIHSLECHLLGRYYRRIYNIPIVYTCHSLIEYRRSHSLKKKRAFQAQHALFNMARVITVPSEWLKRDIRKKKRRLKKTIYVIPNGVDIPDQSNEMVGARDPFEVNSHSHSHSHSLSYSQSQKLFIQLKRNETMKTRLLYVGRLNEEKGISELIHAIALLKKRSPSIRLYIVGKGSGKYQRMLKRKDRKSVV